MGLGHKSGGFCNFTFKYKGKEVKFHTQLLQSSKHWGQAAYDNIDDSRQFTRQEMLELAEMPNCDFKNFITHDQ